MATGQRNVGRTPFAACLVELMDRERIGSRELARIIGRPSAALQEWRSGLSEDRREERPRPETLRLLAEGLATDPVAFAERGVRRIEAAKADRYYRELMAASGYLEGIVTLGAALPPGVLAAIAEAAEVAAVLMRCWGRWDDRVVEGFLAFLRERLAEGEGR